MLVQTMETLFCSIFGWWCNAPKWLAQDIVKTAEKDIIELHKCGITQCLHRLHQYVKLYMTVGIHHAKKISNKGMKYGHKGNREMIKLCHNKTFTNCLHCKYLHTVHIIFHQYLHTLHQSTHIITPYIVQHGIAHLMGKTLASLAWDPVVMVSWDLGARQVIIHKGIHCGSPHWWGLPLWKFYDILKHKKDFIFNLL